VTLRTQVAKLIFQNRGCWNSARADEHFWEFAKNPRNLEPEIRLEVQSALKDADSVLALVIELCAQVAEKCDWQDDIDNGAAATGAARNAAERIRALGQIELTSDANQ
jgi:hypothetical protein